MRLETVTFSAGVAADLRLDDGRYVIQVFDAELGDATISGFADEAEARTFLLFGDFDDTRDNDVRVLGAVGGLHWS